MCDCCQQENRDRAFLCGEVKDIHTVYFYNIKGFDKNAVQADFCHLCEIELFQAGERVFLDKYPQFAHFIRSKKRKGG